MQAVEKRLSNEPGLPRGAAYCPNCKATGVPVRVTPGSFALEVLLWLTFILPGVIYSVWRLAARHRACACCGWRYVVSVNQ